MSRPGSLALALALAACGSGTNKVSGSYRGHSVDAADAALVLATGPTGDAITLVSISSQSDVCGAMQIGPLRDQSVIAIALGIVDEHQKLVPATADGRYDLSATVPSTPGSKIALVTFFHAGACKTDLANALNGSVTISHLELTGQAPSRLVGTFSATFDTGEGFAGSFDALACNGGRLEYYICK